MKKNIFFLCCMLFISTAFCQYSVTVSEQSIHGETVKSIIRECRYPATITCVFSSNNSSTFIYSDQTMLTREFTVQNLKVNDMIVMLHGTDGRSDSLFFCGRDLNTGLATFGFFNIRNAFNGSGPVSLHKPYMSGEESFRVRELTRMVHFNDGVNYHFVCVGTNENANPCLVEEIMPPPPAICDYRTGTLVNTNETMHDVKMALSYQGDHLVTAGMDTSFNGGVKYLTLRVYDINDIFAPSGVQDFKYIFCIDTAFGVDWEKEDVLVRHLEDGFFATVSYLKPKLYNDVVWGSRQLNHLNSVHVGVFKLNTLLSLSVSGMISSTVFEPLSLTGNNLTEFVRGPYLTMAFQERIVDNGPFLSSNYCEIDFNTLFNVSSVRKFNTLGDVYTGMNNYNNPYNLVMSGFKRDTLSILRYSMETISSLKSCYPNKKYDYINYNPYRSVIMKKSFVTVSKRSEYDEINVEQVIVPLTIDCEN